MRAHNVDAMRAGLLALAFLAVCGAAAAEVRNPHGVAVIIGNKDYRHKDVPPVAYAHRDAEAFKRYVLEVLGFAPGNVFELRDADRGAMFKALGRRGGKMSDLGAVLARLPEGGEVVVYYSGHGVPGREGGKGYLLPVNVAPRAAQEDGYPLDLLYEKLGSLARARSVRVFLDACFSGGSHAGFLVQGASPVAMSAAMPAEASDKVTVLAAAEGSQLASWDEEAGHGLFTHHLLDALYGRGDRDGDGRVTASEARAYLDAHMSSAAWLSHGREQQAVLLKSGEAEVVLASAGGGGFPARPVLDDSGSGADEDRKGGTGGEGKVVSPLPDPAVAEKDLELDLAAKIRIQRSLVALGFEAGPADGAFGPKMREAVRAWQASKGYGATGYLTEGQAEALLAFVREAEREKREAEERRRAEAERRAREEAARRERERRAEEERKRKEDDAAYARAKQSHTASGYRTYLESCDVCGHKSEAEALLAEVTKPKWEAGEKFRDCADCPELVVVPSGSFMMGSPGSEAGRYDDEGPVRRVTIAHPFAVGVYEVTFEEWDACVSGGGCGGHRPDDWGWGRGKRPVMNVSWNDAKGYVRWLSGETGEAYRLLSEAEWEYVARAGTTGPFHTGATISTEQANYDGNYIYGSGRKGRYREQTSRVGMFSVNAFGLHDVHGNVWEWVEDCWNRSYHGAPEDGRAWESGDCSARVLRGGSWGSEPRLLRSAVRGWSSSGDRSSDAGFRVARTLTP